MILLGTPFCTLEFAVRSLTISLGVAPSLGAWPLREALPRAQCRVSGVTEQRLPKAFKQGTRC